MTSEVAPEGSLDVDLVEDSSYRWRLQPVDEHGLEGPWTDWEGFFVDTENAAPSDIEFLSPDEGEEVGTEPSFEVT